MLLIDGSMGEGGGQIIRSAMSLSLATGKAFTVENVRAGRAKPGLMRQHLTAVMAAAKIGNADVQGAVLRSSRLVFVPGKVQAGNYEFSVGTAGSTTLVFQTVLPALLLAEGPSQLTLEGGTHNPHAPPFDFLQEVYLPLVRRMGPQVQVKLERAGFYPAGGGRFTATITPAAFQPLTLLERGAITDRRMRAIVANLPRQIAERESAAVAEMLNWDPSCFHVEQMESPGPGNIVMIAVRSEHVNELCTGWGEIGVKAETVGKQAAKAVQSYLAAGVPVGEYLTDQLLLPLGLGAHFGGGGGEFRTLGLSRHAETHMEILKRFLDISIDVERHHRHCDVRLR